MSSPRDTARSVRRYDTGCDTETSVRILGLSIVVSRKKAIQWQMQASLNVSKLLDQMRETVQKKKSLWLQLLCLKFVFFLSQEDIDLDLEHFRYIICLPAVFWNCSYSSWVRKRRHSLCLCYILRCDSFTSKNDKLSMFHYEDMCTHTHHLNVWLKISHRNYYFLS